MAGWAPAWRLQKATAKMAAMISETRVQGSFPTLICLKRRKCVFKDVP